MNTRIISIIRNVLLNPAQHLFHLKLQMRARAVRYVQETVLLMLSAARLKKNTLSIKTSALNAASAEEHCKFGAIDKKVRKEE